MSTPTGALEIESVIEIGHPEALRSTNMWSQVTLEINRRVSSAVHSAGNNGDVVSALWPLQRSFGAIQIRWNKEVGFHIFDAKSKTMTGSPVRDVLDVANDAQGNTYAFVYGNVLGGENDDRYAWVSTRDGSLLSGTINDEPVRKLPEGLVALTA